MALYGQRKVVDSCYGPTYLIFVLEAFTQFDIILTNDGKLDTYRGRVTDSDVDLTLLSFSFFTSPYYFLDGQ